MKSGIWGHSVLFRRMALFSLAAFMVISTASPAPAAGAIDAPPGKVVRLVFIHHSCGENWLADDNGGLGKALDHNNYFVSDTNYGWGPHGIGDSTDITDWPRWFTGDDREIYLQALYREGGQHAPFTRRKSDPGGENQIVMFKSCFPNSNLQGRPADAPRRGEGLTVANAKAIYSDLLTYFESRPDKLFIAITAPPVQDPTHAANARAFNRWLVTDWLKTYPGLNVAVFDFYNVLTGPSNHHRFRNGRIEHVVAEKRDTLYYPSDGDDHPTHKGNRKATGEFVSLLNVYYHRWLGEQASLEPAAVAAGLDREITEVLTPLSGTVAAQKPAQSLVPPVGGDVIDDFEQETNDWTVFSDEGNTNTRLNCQREISEDFRGKAGLGIAYTVAPESWATCSLVFPTPRDWRTKSGLSLYLRAERPDQELHIVAYQGVSTDSLSHFEYNVRTTAATAAGWQRVDIVWQDLKQPAWEGDGTASFDPGRVMGLAFAFNGGESGETAGKIWVDDIGFLSK